MTDPAADRRKGQLSFVTVVHLGELESLRLQARSIAIFVSAESLCEILVMVNDRHEAECRAAVRAILGEYGIHTSKVRILGAADVFPAVPLRWAHLAVLDRVNVSLKRLRLAPVRGGWHGYRGWRTQQCFKLASANVLQGSSTVILDAKNFFITEVAYEDFFNRDGKAKISFVPPDANHARWLKRSSRALRVAAEPVLERDLPVYTTPFPVSREVLAGTVQALEQLNGPVHYAMTINPRSKKVTEFMLIVLACHYCLGGLCRHFADGGLRALATSGRMSLQDIANLLKRVVTEEIKVFGVHRKSWARFGEDERLKFAELLRGRGLLGGSEAEAAFLGRLMSQ